MKFINGKKGEGEADPKMSLGSMILIALGLLAGLFVLFLIGKQIMKTFGLF